MRIQITLEAQTKLSAEARARHMGYSSLASLLKVLSINLARENTAAQEESPRKDQEIPMAPRNSPPPPSLEPVIIRQPTLPNPDQFTVWPTFLSQSIWQTDPELYLFYIETGYIR